MEITAAGGAADDSGDGTTATVVGKLSLPVPDEVRASLEPDDTLFTTDTVATALVRAEDDFGDATAEVIGAAAIELGPGWAATVRATGRVICDAACQAPGEMVVLVC